MCHYVTTDLSLNMAKRLNWGRDKITGEEWDEDKRKEIVKSLKLPDIMTAE